MERLLLSSSRLLWWLGGFWRWHLFRSARVLGHLIWIQMFCWRLREKEILFNTKFSFQMQMQIIHTHSSPEPLNHADTTVMQPPAPNSEPRPGYLLSRMWQRLSSCTNYPLSIIIKIRINTRRRWKKEEKTINKYRGQVLLPTECYKVLV